MIRLSRVTLSLFYLGSLCLHPAVAESFSREAIREDTQRTCTCNAGAEKSGRSAPHRSLRDRLLDEGLAEQATPALECTCYDVTVKPITANGGLNFQASISRDGHKVVFISDHDLNQTHTDLSPQEIYLGIQRRNESGDFTDVWDFKRITTSVGADGCNARPVISGDGLRVAFSSTCVTNVESGWPGTPGVTRQIYRADVSNPDSIRITRITNAQNGTVNTNIDPSINGDGTRITFISDRDPQGNPPNPANPELYLWIEGRPTPYTRITNTDATLGCANSKPSINWNNGTRIAFASDCTLNVAGMVEDLPGTRQIYRAEIGDPSITLRKITNAQNGDANTNIEPSISGDGTRIAFISNRNPTGDPPNPTNPELYLWVDGRTTPFDRLTNSNATPGCSNNLPSINANDGKRITFTSTCALLSPNPNKNPLILMWIEGFGLLRITNRASPDSDPSDVNLPRSSLAGEGKRLAFDYKFNLIQSPPLPPPVIFQHNDSHDINTGDVSGPP